MENLGNRVNSSKRDFMDAEGNFNSDAWRAAFQARMNSIKSNRSPASLKSDTVPGTILGYSKSRDAKVVKYRGRYYFYLDGEEKGSTNELRTAQYWANKFGVELDEGELGEAANGQREMYGQSVKVHSSTSSTGPDVRKAFGTYTGGNWKVVSVNSEGDRWGSYDYFIGWDDSDLDEAGIDHEDDNLHIGDIFDFYGSNYVFVPLESSLRDALVEFEGRLPTEQDRQHINKQLQDLDALEMGIEVTYSSTKIKSNRIRSAVKLTGDDFLGTFGLSSLEEFQSEYPDLFGEFETITSIDTEDKIIWDDEGNPVSGGVGYEVTYSDGTIKHWEKDLEGNVVIESSTSSKVTSAVDMDSPDYVVKRGDSIISFNAFATFTPDSSVDYSELDSVYGYKYWPLSVIREYASSGDLESTDKIFNKEGQFIGTAISSSIKIKSSANSYYKVPDGTVAITDGINNILCGYYDWEAQKLFLYTGETLYISPDDYDSTDDLESAASSCIPTDAVDSGIEFDRYDGGRNVWWRFSSVIGFPLSKEDFQEQFVPAEKSEFMGRVEGTYVNDSSDWYNLYGSSETKWLDYALDVE